MLALRELQPLEEGQAVPAREVADLLDVLVAHGDGQVLGLESRTMAAGAGHLTDEFLQVGPHGRARGLLVFLEQDGAHARELGEPVRIAPVTGVVVHTNLSVTQAIEQGLLRLLREVLPGRLVRLAQMSADGGEDLRVVVGVTKDRIEDAVLDREGRILDECLGVHDATGTEAVAVWTGTVGSVEREVTRLEIIYRVAVLWTGERERVLEELTFCPLGRVLVGQQVEAHASRGEARRRLYGLGHATQAGLAHDDAVNHDFDGVLVLLVELDGLGEITHLAVHAHAGEALLGEVLEELGVLALAT